MFRLLKVFFVSSGILLASWVGAAAAPAEYVKVCDAYGAGYFYSPGSETCINASTGETRTDDATGSTELKSRVDDIERRIDDAFGDMHQYSEQASIAAALADPDFISGEHFGLRVNWANAGGADAVGITGAAVLSEGMFGSTGRLTGSLGVGFSGGTVGGRAGLQLTW